MPVGWCSRNPKPRAGDEHLREEQNAQLVVWEGEEAPDFTLKDQNGQPVTLSNFRHVKTVLLVFFPLAFTGICQGELDEIRDRLTDLRERRQRDAGDFGRPAATHKVWATQSGFTFPVLSDFWPHGVVAQSYGVFNHDTGFANRGTFVVDRSGIIRFAEMKPPGEPRDQAVWADALDAVQSG